MYLPLTYYSAVWSKVVMGCLLWSSWYTFPFWISYPCDHSAHEVPHVAVLGARILSFFWIRPHFFKYLRKPIRAMTSGLQLRQPIFNFSNRHYKNSILFQIFEKSLRRLF